MEAVKEKVGGFGLSRRDSRTFIHEFAFRVSYMGFCVNYRGGIEGVQDAIDQIRETGGGKDYRNTVRTNCIKIDKQGVSFVERKRERDISLSFIPLRKISYGVVCEKDSSIFAFNHHISPNHVECHAVISENDVKAREMNEALYAVFKTDHFGCLRNERQMRLERLQKMEENERENGVPRRDLQ